MISIASHWAPRATRLTGALAAVALIAGCATPAHNAPKLPPYAGPVNGPTAKLVSRGSLGTGDIFGVLIYDDALACRTPKLATVASPALAPKTVQVPAGQLLTVDYLFIRGNPSQGRKSCGLRASFTPVAGKTYLMAGTLAADGSCKVALLDATQPDDMHPEHTAVRRAEPGNVCVPMASAKPLNPKAAARAAASKDDAVLESGATDDALSGLITGH